MTEASAFRYLCVVWHRTFGQVKCHLSSRCPVCSNKDWPTASWVSA